MIAPLGEKGELSAMDYYLMICGGYISPNPPPPGQVLRTINYHHLPSPTITYTITYCHLPSPTVTYYHLPYIRVFATTIDSCTAA
jgi:hypothetical protein